MIRAVFVVAALLAAPVSSLADDLASRIGTCDQCHGEKGIPVDSSVPVIAGQNEGYLYLELRDYKLGNRKNEIMQAIAADLEKADMRALAAHYAAETWPNLQQPAAPKTVADHALTVASSAVCTSCHLENYQGNSAIPRAAGQGTAYLKATMLAFKTGERGNNPWMSALLKTFSDDDIDALATYLAGL